MSTKDRVFIRGREIKYHLNEIRKKLQGFFVFQYGKILKYFLLGHLTKHKPVISEECMLLI